MKIKSPKTIGLIVFLGVFVFNLQPALAASYICDVGMVGGFGPDVKTMVKLTHVSDTPIFTNCWFKVPQNSTNYFLSILLTAVSLEKRVRVTLTGTTKNSWIVSLYLIP